VRIVSVPDPVPKEGEVLIAVKGSGICGSDKWLWNVSEKIEYVFGHEAAGEVVALGPGVKRRRVGERVAVYNEIGCGKCPACRAGEVVYCPTWKEGDSVNGGFGELLVAPEANCLRLADEVDDAMACMIFDNFGTPFSALETANVGPGDDVIIAGLGPIGLAAVMLARLRGAFVIALDPVAYRREAALRLGANLALPSDDDAVAAIREFTDGLGARVALECTGKVSSYPLLMSALRRRGVLVAVGGGGRIDLRVDDPLIQYSLTITGSNYSTLPIGQKVHDLFRLGAVDPKALVTHTAPLTDFPRLFSIVCEMQESVLKAVILNE
jgi:threonine dehydrogenase-like Zn-dependent dehydrogenase